MGGFVKEPVLLYAIPPNRSDLASAEMLDSEVSTAIRSDPLQAVTREQKRGTAKQPPPSLFKLFKPAENEQRLTKSHRLQAELALNRAVNSGNSQQPVEPGREGVPSVQQDSKAPAPRTSAIDSSSLSHRNSTMSLDPKPRPDPPAKRLRVEFVDLTMDSDTENSAIVEHRSTQIHPTRPRVDPTLSNQNREAPLSTVTSLSAQDSVSVVAGENVQAKMALTRIIIPSQTQDADDVPQIPLVRNQEPQHVENIAASGSSKARRASQRYQKGDSEAKRLKTAIEDTILSKLPEVSWDDIAGLNAAKKALMEAAILPFKFPRLFTGNCKPVSGILLYGPPGTGKTYLANAVASESKSRFFTISSSALVNKWAGESEQLIKQLFMAARRSKPSIIFMDEIDALCGSRNESTSEASRRLIAELLAQMSGVGNDQDGVVVLGATSTPWHLDAAVLRRFERRIYIALPDSSSRARLFELNTNKSPNTLNAEEYERLAKATQGYSSHDIVVVAKDALMQPVRKLQQATHFKEVTPNGSAQRKLTPCNPDDDGATEMHWTDVNEDELEVPPVTISDFTHGVSLMRPSVNKKDLSRYSKFTDDFGQKSV